MPHSGTAIKTAQMIENVRIPKKQGHPEEIEIVERVKGSKYVRHAYS